MFTTADNVHHTVSCEVVNSIGDRETIYDVDGITAVLIAEFDLVGPTPTMTVAEIDPHRFWDVVAAHEIPAEEGE